MCDIDDVCMCPCMCRCVRLNLYAPYFFYFIKFLIATLTIYYEYVSILVAKPVNFILNY